MSATERSPAAIVTGASSGIGAELARLFAADGHAVVLVARREAELEALADEIAAAGRPRPVVVALDLAAPDAVARLKEALAARGLAAKYLVNNAGFGLLGVATSLDADEQLAMIDLNVKSLTALSLTFADDLVRQRGGLLNVGSLAGFMAGPGMAVYYATKAYVISFSEALWRELGPKGVTVTVLCPGPVPTGFQARAGVTVTGLQSMLTVTAAQAAKVGYDGLMAGRRMVIPGRLASLVPLLARILPRRSMIGLIASTQIRRLGSRGGL
ncbi:SDR family NAD(P)-dependent oxidoreductase [Rhodoplanes roseus]|uniref:SDR family NAD(P)-dependent oxidoreductase n=1 Tax=Rhodoplanes roseus TaxID=29409 RepID=UPI001FDEC4EC|nr:SDR family oxidoreductase [Rhodoplanes roseus]